MGWHVHYPEGTDTEGAAASTAGALYQPEEVRLDLMLRHRIVEDLESTDCCAKRHVAALDARLASPNANWRPVRRARAQAEVVPTPAISR